MQPSKSRLKLRQFLNKPDVVYPGSVFDPISARIVVHLGFEVGIMGGSLVSATILAAPDLVLLTQSELADHVKRIMRAVDISLIVDADHGYGNALNVMRTVQELEMAGAAAMTIEDTLLPKGFKQESDPEYISKDEMIHKLRAATEARRDPSTVIIGRTSALQNLPLDEAMDRIEAYSKTGVDAMMVMGCKNFTELSEVHSLTSLPLILGYVPREMQDRKKLAESGVRVALRGHYSFYVAMQALFDSMKFIYEGGDPLELRPKMATPEVIQAALRTDDYQKWQSDYLK